MAKKAKTDDSNPGAQQAAEGFRDNLATHGMEVVEGEPGVITVAVTDPNAADATQDAPSPSSDGEQPTPEDRRTKNLERAFRKLDTAQLRRSQCEAAVEQARGNLKTAIGDVDAAVAQLQKVWSGKSDPKLPGMEDAHDVPDDTAVMTGDGTNWPISELGTKQLAKLVGDQVMESCKDRAEPIGLTQAQLDKLESAEIHTIADLEKNMREVRDWWLVLAKKQDADVVRRVVDSLREFRVVNRHEETSTQTIVEKLADQNAQPLSETLEPEPAAVA